MSHNDDNAANNNNNSTTLANFLRDKQASKSVSLAHSKETFPNDTMTESPHDTESSHSEQDFAGGEDVELRQWSMEEEEEEEHDEQVGPGKLVKMPSQQLVSLSDENCFYGNPLTEQQAVHAMPEGGDGGLIWNALVVPNEFIQNGKLIKGLSERDFHVEQQTIKPRRSTLPIFVSDFFGSLTKILPGQHGPRWIFHGVLNGWPALTCLELVSIQARRNQEGLLGTAKDAVKGKWVHYWRADREGKDGIDPTIPKNDNPVCYQAKLRGAPWTAIGWSEEIPGFVFWYEPMNGRLNYGTNMISLLSDEEYVSMVHMVSHRYAVAKESPKDRLTYHSIVLLEWDHGKYCTVVEGAYLNGLGGYKGKSNWYDDKNEPVTELYQCMPNEMIAPWLTCSAEIRCYDIKARNLDEFKLYIEKYQGSRFRDPHFTFSHKARLSYRSKRNIAQYCLNYEGRDCSYDELKRNCQTFAADFCAFLAGKNHVEPFHPVNRIQYENRTYLFLYESSMYESTTKQAGRKKKI
jgi:hypothetical protein